MTLGQIASHVDTLAAALRIGDQKLDTALGALMTAYEQIAMAAESLNELLVGSEGPSAIRRLAEDATENRELVAELALVLIKLRNPALDSAKKRAVIDDGSKGMHAHRLATWEADALREIAAAALAGKGRP